ncbi:MAG: class I SAM-dependent methyltransferase [bacterium]
MALKEISNPGQLMEMVNAFRVSRIILTAHELRIFDFLKNEGRSSSEVARLLGTDPRATNRIMNALVSLGLLRKTNDIYSNTGFTGYYLVSDSPQFLGGLSHAAHLWKTWNTLTHCVAAGTSVAVDKEINERPEDWRESFIAAMHSRAGQQAKDVASILELPEQGHILDVGGGSGVFAFAFLTYHPNLKATVFDLPNIVPITEKYIRNAGLEDSVKTIAGDYLNDPFGKDYALIFMSAIIHINSPAENEALIRKGASSLSPGGKLVILDHFMSDDRTEPATGAIFALNMLVGTDHGDTYTESEIRKWMSEAGLSNIRRKDTKEGVSILIGVNS